MRRIATRNAAASLGAAAAMVVSALALEGLAASGAGPQVQTVVVKTQVAEKAPDAKGEERPVRVLKDTPAPKAVLKKRVIPPPPPAKPAIADLVVMAGNNNARVQQQLQQFRPILRSEYHVVRAVCRPSPDHRREIARAGEQAVRDAARAYVGMMHRAMTPAQRAALDPRKQIRAGLAEAVKEKLGPEPAARLQEEIARRDAARKQLAVRNLVARLDHDLVLGPDQRGRIAESLEAHWDESWCQSLEMFLYDNQFVPPIPDAYVAPFLDENQKRIWRGTQKVQAFWGGFGMMGGIMADDPLEDEELRLARQEAAKNDPKPDPNQPGVFPHGAVMEVQIAQPVEISVKAVRKEARAPEKARARPTDRKEAVPKK